MLAHGHALYERMRDAAEKAAYVLHSCAARSRITASAYLSLLSIIFRSIDRPVLSDRVAGSVSTIPWPNITFRPRAVRAAGVDFVLHPYFGDLSVLFAKTLHHESTFYCWLEANAGEFDAVIEIGANVGMFTVFFDRLARRSGARLKQIYAFEPSPLTFERLRANILANECSHVTAFNVAVGEHGGMLPFYEPAGHLDMCSFNREFVARWSNNFKERLVAAIAAQDLEALFRRHDRILLKMDVETYEPLLISALASILGQYRPAIIVEVLKSTEKAIDAAPWPPNYRAYLLDDNVTEHPHFFADPKYRDWLVAPLS